MLPYTNGFGLPIGFSLPTGSSTVTGVLSKDVYTNIIKTINDKLVWLNKLDTLTVSLHKQQSSVPKSSGSNKPLNNLNRYDNKTYMYIDWYKDLKSDISKRIEKEDYSYPTRLQDEKLYSFLTNPITTKNNIELL